MSAALNGFFKEWIHPYDPGETVRSVFRASFDIERTPADFAFLIERNQMFSQFLVNCDLIKNRKDFWNDGEEFKKVETISVSRACNFLGRQLTRNLIATICINRTKNAGLPRRGGDKLLLPVETELKCAIQAQEKAEEVHANGELAFAAGFCFDQLRALFERKKAPPEAKKEWQDAWTRGLEIAKEAHQLAKGIGKFELGSAVYAAALLSQLHRPFLTLLYPKGGSGVSWADIQKRKDSAKTGTDYFRVHLEMRKNLPLYPAQVRTLIFRTLGFFSHFENALIHIDDPAALSQKAPNPQQRLAQLIVLTDMKQKKLPWVGWAAKHADPLGLRQEAKK